MGFQPLEFASELATEQQQSLFSNPELIDELRRLKASVSISLIDLVPARLPIVKRLNEAAVAVTAWLALSEEQGYWLNPDNAPAATAHFEAFKSGPLRTV